MFDVPGMKPMCCVCATVLEYEEPADDEALSYAEDRRVLPATSHVVAGDTNRLMLRGPDMQAVRLRAGLPAQLPETAQAEFETTPAINEAA